MPFVISYINNNELASSGPFEKLNTFTDLCEWCNDVFFDQICQLTNNNLVLIYPDGTMTTVDIKSKISKHIPKNEKVTIHINDHHFNILIN